MKTLFRMTAAVLMVVMMLFVSVPGSAKAEKVSLTEMVSIKKAADEALQAAKAQAEKAKTDEEKWIVKQLLKQAETNAEVAGDLLEAVKAGEEVSREEVETCAAVAKAVHEAAGALAAGDIGKAERVMGRIAELGSSLPTAANARAEMQSTTGAGKPPVIPPVNGKKAYCENNNIMRPNGNVFSPCGEKRKCEENPYGAVCVPQKPVCSKQKKEECAENPSPSSTCLSCRQTITETCTLPDGTKKVTVTVTEWYCK